jgi:osmotically-inducible protein OsmY
MNSTKRILLDSGMLWGLLLGLLPSLALARDVVTKDAAAETRRDAPGVTSGANPNSRSPDVDFAMSDEDRETTRRLRETIVDDDDLSVYGKNIAIVVERNTVTLRGSVPSYQEKALLEAKAKDVVGKKRVVNDIEVMAE